MRKWQALRPCGKPPFLFLGLLLLLTGAESGGAKVQIKMASQAPERSVWGKALKDIAAALVKETAGQVELKVYPGGVQGDDSTVLRRMRIGQLHGAVFIGTGVSEICPDSLVLHIPFLFDNEDEVERVLEQVCPRLEQQARDNGYEVVGWPRLGFAYLFSKKEVASVEALRMAKPWLIQHDLLTRHLYETLRVTPVTIGVADVLPALETGLVETVFSPPMGLVALQWHGAVKYRLDLNIMYSFGMVVISRKEWERIPAALQKNVREIFARSIAELNGAVRAQNAEALSVLAKGGVKTLPPEAASHAEFQRAALEVGKKMAGKDFSEAARAEVYRLIEAYRKEKSRP
ncbi:MAG: TRAP transporter substrate-binding protein DctP [Planctomycetes bacterium]|nr:TRAP transporter substrate-binding protein DctP [Planctomycetota bacterium]